VDGYDWAEKARDIDDLSQRCSDCIPQLQEEEIRERWKRQLQEMQESRTILGEIRRILDEVASILGKSMRTRRKEISFKISRPTTKVTRTSTHRGWQARASGSSTMTGSANGETAAPPAFFGSPLVLGMGSRSYCEL